MNSGGYLLLSLKTWRPNLQLQANSNNPASKHVRIIDLFILLLNIPFNHHLNNLN